MARETTEQLLERLQNHLDGIDAILGGNTIAAINGEIRGQEWRIRKIDELKAQLTRTRAVLGKVVEALETYGEHSQDCMISNIVAGRPTSDGGYEYKICDHWCRKEDVKCTCGLDEALTEAAEVEE